MPPRSARLTTSVASLSRSPRRPRAARRAAASAARPPAAGRCGCWPGRPERSSTSSMRRRTTGTRADPGVAGVGEQAEEDVDRPRLAALGGVHDGDAVVAGRAQHRRDERRLEHHDRRAAAEGREQLERRDPRARAARRGPGRSVRRAGAGQLVGPVGGVAEDQEVAVGQPAQQLTGLLAGVAVELARVAPELVGQPADQPVQFRTVLDGVVHVGDHPAQVLGDLVVLLGADPADLDVHPRLGFRAVGHGGGVVDVEDVSDLARLVAGQHQERVQDVLDRVPGDLELAADRIDQIGRVVGDDLDRGRVRVDVADPGRISPGWRTSPCWRCSCAICSASAWVWLGS